MATETDQNGYRVNNPTGGDETLEKPHNRFPSVG
jgi:hypothetical protein